MTELFTTSEEPAGLAALRADLVVRAERDGLLDVAYGTVDSPFGPLLLAATEQGLVRVAYAVEDHDAVLTTLAAAVSPRLLSAPARFDGHARQFERYFAGTSRGFTVRLDLRLAHGFRRAVLDRLTMIDYGRTQSYGEVAAAAGSPRASRAVGTACATNPLPIVVPCHRVVRSDGTLGQYLAGTDAKRTLLELEGAAP